MHVKNSKSRKYGGLPSNPQEKCTSGNDQHPKSLRKTNNALTNHKWDDAWNTHQKDIEKQQKKATREMMTVKAVTTTTTLMVMRNCNSHKRKRHVTVVVKQDT